MPRTSHHLQGIDGGHTGAQAIDHLGPPRHPHRVTIMNQAQTSSTVSSSSSRLRGGSSSAPAGISGRDPEETPAASPGPTEPGGCYLPPAGSGPQSTTIDRGPTPS